MTQQIGAGIIGCGNIAGPYSDDFAHYPEIAFIGAADIDAGRARDLAAKHSVTAYDTIGALLADPAIELVVNLTAFAAHREVMDGIRTSYTTGRPVAVGSSFTPPRRWSGWGDNSCTIPSLRRAALPDTDAQSGW